LIFSSLRKIIGQLTHETNTFHRIGNVNSADEANPR
jgi:hypothetical protein